MTYSPVRTAGFTDTIDNMTVSLQRVDENGVGVSR